MAAHAQFGPVGPRHHDRGVPPDITADTAFDLFVAGVLRLSFGREGVDVIGAAQRCLPHALSSRARQSAQHHIACSTTVFFVDQLVERRDPLLGFFWVDVWKLGWQALMDYRRAL